MPRRPPFSANDPDHVERSRLGGKASGESRRRKAASDPLTLGLLGHLIGLTTGDWMDRLGLTEPSWNAWRVVGKVLDNLPLDPAETVIYTQLTGRTTVPSDLRELWCLAGRGSGKTSFTAVQAIRTACTAMKLVLPLPLPARHHSSRRSVGTVWRPVSDV